VAVRSKASGKRGAAALSNGVPAGVNRWQRTKTSWVVRCVLCRRPRQASHSSADARLEYCSSEVPTYSDLTDEADDILFSRIMANHGHVLQPLLPDRHSIPYSPV